MSKNSLSLCKSSTPSTPLFPRQQKFPPQLSIISTLSLVVIGFFSVAQKAMAHHAMGGRMPANFFEGFISGLAHPIIGLDHFAFIVAIGFLAVGLSRGALIPAGFVIASLAGTGLHLLKLNLPGNEIIIACSVIVFGILLVAQKQLNFTWLIALAAVAGLFHGYAYGESIVGAEMTPLFAYLLGFSIIQYAIALTALATGNLLTQKFTNLTVSPLRLAGFAISAIGVVFLTNSLIS
ncbi:HupE/UreJ family protein [Phormidium sp. LEGE 05292]|uniref:HupE/UreJ family protein n=1 Tax=[Phormidium] sp. LEGE 05292 TaxID=767427 RepID=UPI001881E22D|nr:HupE/UreJ family protein [Phormidium sp. LEGE 05292]MBE9225038.1 HupE/UreJ family protein [Phormidium sp. LEGE 05292]